MDETPMDRIALDEFRPATVRREVEDLAFARDAWKEKARLRAIETDSLAASLAAMERERDAWREEAKAWRAVYDKARSGSGAGTTVNFREAMNARAAADALMKQSPESATKEPPHA